MHFQGDLQEALRNLTFFHKVGICDLEEVACVSGFHVPYFLEKDWQWRESTQGDPQLPMPCAVWAQT